MCVSLVYGVIANHLDDNQPYMYNVIAVIAVGYTHPQKFIPTKYCDHKNLYVYGRSSKWIYRRVKIFRQISLLNLYSQYSAELYIEHLHVIDGLVSHSLYFVFFHSVVLDMLIKSEHSPVRNTVHKRANRCRCLWTWQCLRALLHEHYLLAFMEDQWSRLQQYYWTSKHLFPQLHSPYHP